MALPPIQEAVVLRPPQSILIHGVFGSRKSTTAATFSEFYPALPAEAPFDNLELEDLFYLCWDKDAMLCFPRLVKPGGKIIVPHQDLSSVAPKDLYATIPEIHQRVAERVKSGKTKVIIHDTVSSFDTKLYVACSQTFDKGAGKQTEEGDGEALGNANQVLFRAVLNTHDQEFSFYTSLPGVTNIFLSHSEPKGDIRVNQKNKAAYLKAKMQNDAKGLTEMQISAALTGKAWKHYHENCALVAYIEKRVVSGVDKSFLYPTGGKSSISRDRTGFLAQEEPADFRVLIPKMGGRPK